MSEKISRAIFDFFLGRRLFPCPFSRTQFGDSGNLSLLTGILLNFMETADIHIENRVSFVVQYSRFLYVASNFNLLKTHELANPVVHMNDKVTDIEFFQLFDREIGRASCRERM